MRLRNWINEKKSTKTMAFWISPNGDVIGSVQTHISMIISNPEKFGLKKEDIAQTYKSYNEPIGHEGKAREMIIKRLLRKKWIRIRKYPNVGYSADFLHKSLIRWDYLKEWAHELLTKGIDGLYENDRYIPVNVMDMGNFKYTTTLGELAGLSEKIMTLLKFHKTLDTFPNISYNDFWVSEEIMNEEIQILDESSLSRVWQHNEEHDCAAMTAFRKARDCGKGEEYTKKENKARNKSLLSKLKSKGYSVTSLKGKYPEGGTEGKEESFFIVDIDDRGKLLNDVKMLGEMFEQDSVLFIPKGAIQNTADAYLIGTNHCENNWLGYGKKEVFNKGKIGYKSPIYTSYVNGRPFIFEDVDSEIVDPGNGMGWWTLHKTAKKEWKELIEG